MAITDSDLKGNFISNTYQKILQVDSNFGATGSDASFNLSNISSTSNHSLLNGSGQKVQVLAIEGKDNYSGLFLKNTTLDINNAWGISTLRGDAVNGNNDVGLSFYKLPVGSSNLHKLFLKNTGSLWVGYQGSASGAGTGVKSDVSGYSLYVKDGLMIGNPSGGNSSKIKMDGEFPFTIQRYDIDWKANDSDDVLTEELKFATGHPKSSQVIKKTEYTCVIVASKWLGENNRQFRSFGCLIVEGATGYKIEMKGDIGGAIEDDLRYIIDVMIIKNGSYYELRDNVIEMPYGGGRY